MEGKRITRKRSVMPLGFRVRFKKYKTNLGRGAEILKLVWKLVRGSVRF